MSNVEHLIENAIFTMKDFKDPDEGFKFYSSAQHNKAMSEACGVDLSVFWEVAQYVLYTYCAED